MVDDTVQRTRTTPGPSPCAPGTTLTGPANITIALTANRQLYRMPPAARDILNA